MFDEERAKKPWKKVALAVFLCLAGAIMLTSGIVIWYKGPGEGSGGTAEPLTSISSINSQLHCMWNKKEAFRGPASAQQRNW
jgi:hypothetical protein